jgi:uncharacterized protein
MSRTIVGVISDTHGLLRPEAKAALRDVSLILHAGDIEDAMAPVLLGSIAPVVAVRGNCDRRGPWPEHQLVTVAERQVYVLHDLGRIDLDPVAAGIAVVVSGHTHVPLCETRQGVLYFNPGSAGPRRGARPATLGRLYFEYHAIRGEIVTLTD